MNSGVEARTSPGKGEGIFALKQFETDDTVLVGVVDRFVDGNNIHASQIGEKQFVLFVGLVNKLNHSCDPNCYAKMDETGNHEFVAKRDIEVGEEVTFDYSLSNYTIEHFPGRCTCGSSTCRGAIVGWKDLPLETKKECERFVAPYLLELDAKQSRSV